MQPPNKYGMYHSDQQIKFKDFIPSDYTALIFEFMVQVQINGSETKQLCLGYTKYIPDINSMLIPMDKDIDIPLVKGPGESYDNELIMSEHSVISGENLFDFGLKAHVSNSNQAPDPKKLNRVYSTLS